MRLTLPTLQQQPVPATHSEQLLSSKKSNNRHDAVLQQIAVAVPPTPNLSSKSQDWDSYEFPLHTDLRPDRVWWDDTQRSLCLAELTVCFESKFDEAAMRKTTKYTDLAEQAELHPGFAPLFISSSCFPPTRALLYQSIYTFHPSSRFMRCA